MMIENKLITETKPTDEYLLRLEASWPGKIPFYHLGTIEKEQAPRFLSSPVDVQNKAAIAYRLASMDANQDILLLMILDSALDLSMYSEVGNLIAGKVASALRLTLSPPQTVESKRLYQILNISKPLSQKRYFHLHQDFIIPIEIQAVSATLETIGHA